MVETAERMREAMCRLSSGVVIVSSWVDGRPWGTTVSSCCSVSIQPMLLLVVLANRTARTRLILEQGCFGVNILARDQIALAQHAAAAGDPVFIDEMVVEDRRSLSSPAVAGALAWVHCDLFNALVVGDHSVIVGEVGEVVLGSPRAPLTYFDRRFEPAADGNGGADA